VELRPAAAFALDELAALVNAAYADYYVPFRLDAAAVQFGYDAFDIDPEASRVALDAGAPVAFANLAVRGPRAWVGGIGVVPEARRRGIAESLMRDLMERARGRGVRELTLEVLEQNDRAYRLYEKLEFEQTRQVEVWSLRAAGPAETAAEPVSVDVAHDRIRRRQQASEPWQRADETLTNLRGLDPAPEALEADGGAAIFRRTATGVSLVQVAADPGSAAALFEAMRRLGDVSVLNLPVDDPAAEALRSLGARLTARQFELARPL
jgi:ribosomal protein S18 acetylase RimI-like enzyme